MATFPEATARLFNNVRICRKCERKTRITIGKMLSGKGVCTRCDSKQLRNVRMKSK